ncbi:MAG: hypothetical protein LUO81_02495 [Methanoregulaceae archaeon]|nr:hypothetical protein [Methanoregulaceae archaeon]
MPQNPREQEDDDEKADKGSLSQLTRYNSFVWLPILEYDPHGSTMITEEWKKPASPSKEIKRV